MTKPHTSNSSSDESSRLAVDINSHGISKPKPRRIKVTHVNSPQIIETNVENFKELVHKLTGMPQAEEEKDGGNNKCHKPKTEVTKYPKASHPQKAMIIGQDDEKKFLSLKNRTKVKTEIKEEQVEDEKMFSGFFDGLKKFNSYMEGLAAFPEEKDEK